MVDATIFLLGPFHKSSYERFLPNEFVEPVLNDGSNEFVALTRLLNCLYRKQSKKIVGLVGPGFYARKIRVEAMSAIGGQNWKKMQDLAHSTA